MRSFFKSIRSSSNSRRINRQPRKLSLQSLENRRVLAATIAAFEPSASGFTAEFSEQVNVDDLNLFDTQGQAAGAADVVLHGATTGDVRGSFVVNGTSIAFVASDGALSPDTYTATLRSAADAFTDLADGELLDGDNDGTAGGDFVTTFTVDAAPPVSVSLPGIVRGPGQDLQTPDGAGLQDGLPIQLSQSEGVTSVTLTIHYDPAMLDISDVQLGADAPAGSQVISNLTVPGTATVSFFSINPLTADQTDFLKLIGSVPDDAAYGTSQVIHLSDLDVNAGAMDAMANDSLQVVAYLGDVNGNERYDAEDARLVARVGVGLDTGFVYSDPTSTTPTNRLFPTIDPVLLGDVTGADGLSPLDSSDILRRVVGLPTPNLPEIPGDVTHAPSDISLSNNSIIQSAPVGTSVGTLTSTDVDAGDTFTYTLVAGTGDTDNASFVIDGDEIKTAVTLDFATQSSYSVRVRSTDSSGLSVEKTFTISVTETNTAPTAIALSNDTIDESSPDGTVVGTLTSTDANVGDTFTYALVAGTGDTDNASFVIDGDQLKTVGTLDFATQSSYSIRVSTTDAGGLSTEAEFTITVTETPANTAPTAIELSNDTIDESSPDGTVVGTLSSTDANVGDTFTYALVAGTGDTDNASFVIDGDQLKTVGTLDFATQSSYSIRVSTTDAGGLSTEAEFTITVTETPANTAPTAIELSNDTIDESSPDGTVVGTLTSTDANVGDTFTYALVAGTGDTDNASFVIDGDQLKTVGTLDFATQSSYSIRVSTTDAGGLSTEAEFTITVTETPANTAPTAIELSNDTIDESSPDGTVVGTLTSTDANVGDTFTYALVAGTGDTDNASFVIDGDQLKTVGTLDFATQSSYSIRVSTTDAGGLSTEAEFTITVTETPANTAPTAIELSNDTIDESSPDGTVVGTLSSTDANVGDTFTYALVAGTGDTDNASFVIDGDQLKTVGTLDFATQSSYSIRVSTTDAGGLSTEAEFTITVTETPANTAPTAIELSNDTIDESSPDGTVVGTLSSTDANVGDTFTYALVAGTGDTDNASFVIDGDQLKTVGTLDFATQSSYSIRVSTTDAGGLSTEAEFTITVTETPANTAPTAIELSNDTIDESSPDGTVVGTLSSTDANVGDTFTYALVAGTGDTDNASFLIDGDQLKTVGTLDFATQSSYSIRVSTTDAGGLSTEAEFTITVTETPANTAPTAIELSNDTIDESSPDGTVVGTLTSTDANVGDTFTYALVAGTGDTDNASFVIDGDQLKTVGTLDFATQSSYSIRVSTTDAGGLSTEAEFTITVTETPANTAPTDIDLSNDTIDESAPIGSVVGTLSAIDANAGDTFTYSVALVEGAGDTDNASFMIDGDQLKTAAGFDFDTQSSYTIHLRVTDAGGLSVEKTFTIHVTETPANSAPTAVNLDQNIVAAGQPVDTVVGALSSVDPDAGDTFTYTIVSDGGGQPDAFKIVGGNLVTNQSFDDAIQDMFSVDVQTEDAGGLTLTQTLEIMISEANVAPTAIAITGSSIPANPLSGTLFGTLSTADANTADSHVYTLVAGDGDADNGSFEIVGNELRSTTDLDSSAQASYSIRVRSEDRYGLSIEGVLTLDLETV